MGVVNFYAKTVGQVRCPYGNPELRPVSFYAREHCPCLKSMEETMNDKLACVSVSSWRRNLPRQVTSPFLH